MAPSRICTPWPAACSGSGRSAGNRANRVVCSAPSSNASITPTPGFLLAVVDLAQIEHLALHRLAAGAALALDNAPVPMLLAVLETPIRSQIHGDLSLRQTGLLKRYLVSTTGEFQSPLIEPTRVFPPPGPKLRRQPVPIEKVGLAHFSEKGKILARDREGAPVRARPGAAAMGRARKGLVTRVWGSRARTGPVGDLTRLKTQRRLRLRRVRAPRVAPARSRRPAGLRRPPSPRAVPRATLAGRTRAKPPPGR